MIFSAGCTAGCTGSARGSGNLWFVARNTTFNPQIQIDPPITARANQSHPPAVRMHMVGQLHCVLQQFNPYAKHNVMAGFDPLQDMFVMDAAAAPPMPFGTTSNMVVIDSSTVGQVDDVSVLLEQMNQSVLQAAQQQQTRPPTAQVDAAAAPTAPTAATAAAAASATDTISLSPSAHAAQAAQAAQASQAAPLVVASATAPSITRHSHCSISRPQASDELEVRSVPSAPSAPSAASTGSKRERRVGHHHRDSAAPLRTKWPAMADIWDAVASVVTMPTLVVEAMHADLVRAHALERAAFSPPAVLWAMQAEYTQRVAALVPLQRVAFNVRAMLRGFADMTRDDKIPHAQAWRAAVVNIVNQKLDSALASVNA